MKETNIYVWYRSWNGNVIMLVSMRMGQCHGQHNYSAEWDG